MHGADRVSLREPRGRVPVSEARASLTEVLAVRSGEPGGHPLDQRAAEAADRLGARRAGTIARGRGPIDQLLRDVAELRTELDVQICESYQVAIAELDVRQDLPGEAVMACSRHCAPRARPRPRTSGRR